MTKIEIFEATLHGDLNRVIELLRENPKRASERAEVSLWDGASGPPGLFNSPLHVAALHNRAEIAKVLIGAGANVNEKGFEGNVGEATPLVLAAFGGGKSSAMIKVLIDSGAHPNHRSSMGASALAVASAHDKAEICKVLLQAGAHADLHSAARLGMVDCLEQLLKVDTELVTQPDPYGGSLPLEEAAWHGQEFSGAVLTRFGATHTIHTASGLGLLNIVTHELHRDPDLIHARDTEVPYIGKGAPPLTWAARANQISTMQFLLHRGASPNHPDWWGYCALDHCAMTGATDTALVLIEAGAEVNRSIRGVTPLSRAKDMGHEILAKVLLRHGALI